MLNTAQKLQVLQSMGLQSEVPLCSIKLSPPETRLLEVKSEDLLQLPKIPQVCCAVLCGAVLCCAILCCLAMLCYAVLCYALLCHAMLCYAMLCAVS